MSEFTNQTDKDRRFAARLLDYAKGGGTFYNDKGEMVSASANRREIEGTPLNSGEAQWFSLDDKTRNDFTQRVIAEIKELLEAGHTECSLHSIVGGIRYNMRKQASAERVKINDHWVPSAGRQISESLDGLFKLNFRGMTNEELPDDKAAEDPQIAPYFFKVIEGGNAA